MALLSIKDLNVSFRLNEGAVHAVNNVSFDIQPGQKLALVGESGSGKSQIAFSLLQLLAKNGQATGEAMFEGENLLTLPQKRLNQIRSNDISIIFQDPMSSLNPYMRIERQLGEVLELHKGLSGAQARKRVLEVLDAVRIPDATNRLRQYPHEFSGGMRQRLVIAMALLCEPKLILADEPTTALDVTVQAQIMALLDEIQRENQTAIMLITHDLGVVAGFCDETVVLYGGRVMERAATTDLFDAPTHPYTKGLLQAIPNIEDKDSPLSAIPGSPPNATHFPSQCPFAPRCAHAIAACHDTLPELTTTPRFRACLRPIEEVTQ